MNGSKVMSDEGFHMMLRISDTNCVENNCFLFQKHFKTIVEHSNSLCCSEN